MYILRFSRGFNETYFICHTFLASCIPFLSNIPACIYNEGWIFNRCPKTIVLIQHNETQCLSEYSQNVYSANVSFYQNHILHQLHLLLRWSVGILDCCSAVLSLLNTRNHLRKNYVSMTSEIFSISFYHISKSNWFHLYSAPHAFR